MIEMLKWVVLGGAAGKVCKAVVAQMYLRVCVWTWWSVNLHAVSGGQVSVDKLLAGQILHPSGHLQPEPHQIFDCRVLNGTQQTSDFGSD